MGQLILSMPVTIAAGIAPKVRIRAHPPPAAPPLAASKPGSFGAGSTFQTHNAAQAAQAEYDRLAALGISLVGCWRSRACTRNCFGNSGLNEGQHARGVPPCAFRHIGTKVAPD